MPWSGDQFSLVILVIELVLGPVTAITLVRFSVMFQNIYDKPVPNFVRLPDRIKIFFGLDHGYIRINYPVEKAESRCAQVYLAVQQGSNIFFTIHDGGKIFSAEWMMYNDERLGQAVPSRTYGGPNYYGGISDHLPVMMGVKW